MRERRVFAFRHAAGEDLGNVRPVLEGRGFAVECVDLFAGSPLPETADAAGLIFMGGPMCANDDLPFLERELGLIRSAAARRQPSFGICLGAQLIAKALGGRVYRSAAPETGWHDIRLQDACRSDPVFSRLDSVESVFQLHEDTFALPPDATLLAGSEICANQAFRRGESVYGVQFHPEVTPAMIEDWGRELSLPLAAPPAACARLAQTCERLLGGWSEFL